MSGIEKNENIVKVSTLIAENGLIAVKRPIDAARRKLAKTFNSDIDILDGILEKKETDASDKLKLEIVKLRMNSYLGILKEDSAEKFKAKEMYFRYQEQMDKQLGGSTAEEENDNSPLLDFDNITQID